MKIRNLNLALTYVSEWGLWEAIRELYSNAIDAGGWYNVTDGDGNLHIHNLGVMPLNSLIMGVSQKPNTVNPIGQYGEGMKLAMLVLHRMGYPVIICSGNNVIRPVTLVESLEGELTPAGNGLWLSNDFVGVLGVEITSGPYRDDTVVCIQNWDGNPDFVDRFIALEDDRISYRDDLGRAILSQVNPDIFVKGVWTEKAQLNGKQLAFGYNFVDVKMNRDRSTIESSSLHREIARIWANVSDPDLWELFFIACRDGFKESEVQLGWEVSNLSENKQAFLEGYRRVFGDSIVRNGYSSDVTAVENRGYKTVHIGYSVDAALEAMGIKTVEDVTSSMIEEFRTPISKRKLNAHHKSNMTRLEKLLSKYMAIHCAGDEPITIEAYHFENSDVRGDALVEQRVIRINAGALNNLEECYGILIEEMAHIIDDTEDFTRKHQNSMLKIAGRLLII